MTPPGPPERGNCGARGADAEQSRSDAPQPGDAPRIFTVGHSNRSAEELAEILNRAGVQTLVDVRTAAGSRRNPQFMRDAMASWLPERGIAYVYEHDLGGFRKRSPDSSNTGWTHPAFRAYADYITSDAYASALARLEALARTRPTCFMCAEAQWWRCHRRIISDTLVVRGWNVLHLGLGRRPRAHLPTEFMVVKDGQVSYPPGGGDAAVAVHGA